MPHAQVEAIIIATSKALNVFVIAKFRSTCFRQLRNDFGYRLSC